MGNFKILFVDDDESFRNMIEHHLRERYHLVNASSAAQALECLEKEPFDLVLSDINMPGMKGYELLAKVKQKYPGTKRALITGWSVDENIQYALQFGVSNIISKSVPFDFKELDQVIKNLISQDIFGLNRYLHSEAVMHILRISKSLELIQVRETMLEYFKPLISDEDRLLVLKLVLDEVLNNAIYHPLQKPKGSFVELPPENTVEIVYGKDCRNIGISVSDYFGKLDSKTILTNLDRCIHPTEESIYDEEGRGLFIIRSMVTRLIVNIQHDVRTEIITLVNTEKGEKEEENKPLMVFEI